MSDRTEPAATECSFCGEDCGHRSVEIERLTAVVLVLAENAHRVDAMSFLDSEQLEMVASILAEGSTDE